MLHLAVINTGMMTTIQMLPTLAQIGVLAAGSYGVIGGRLSTADLWLFYLYTIQLTFPTFMVGWVINIVQRGLAGLAAARRDPRRRRRRSATAPTRCSLERIEGGVEIRDLRFAFPGREDRPALAGVSFRVERGTDGRHRRAGRLGQEHARRRDPAPARDRRRCGAASTATT